MDIIKTVRRRSAHNRKCAHTTGSVVDATNADE